MNNGTITSPLGAFIPFAFPGAPSVGCAFSTRGAGSLSMDAVSGYAGAIPADRLRFLSHFGLERWVELKQTHGDGFVANPAPTPMDAASVLEGDGVSTNRKALALAIKTADCQPVLLTDIRGTAVGALHVGWRGNAMNFPGTGARRFCEAYGLAPADVLAVRGPSLGPSAAEFVNFDREWSETFRPWFNPEHRTMDLWSLTKRQLLDAGLLPEHLFALDLCTRSLPDCFFSHRRGDAGRQVSVVWIKRDDIRP